MSSYIDHYEVGGHHKVIHSWSEHTMNALTWQYGPERAAQIAAGSDRRTLADIEAWQALGSRRAA